MDSLSSFDAYFGHIFLMCACTSMPLLIVHTFKISLLIFFRFHNQ